MRGSVPSPRYSPVCNVLRQWKTRSSLFIESTDFMIHVYRPLEVGVVLTQ